ncbi:MAG: prevent-host-death family protein [Firmicutes bacterium HGW-Firmicutes-15]|nr:MAG: prevent-host-death family protein [Firmicutes bacterium HGW-Firmicutes-15]
MEMSVVMDKPKFDQEQVITSSDISRKYGAIRRRAKEKPLVVTDNGRFDTVILDYHFYEAIYSRLSELEEQEKIRDLSERLEDLEKKPETGVNWRDIRRSGK